MKFIQQGNRNELLSKYRSERDFNYIGEAIQSYNYCYLVALDSSDIEMLILNSSPRSPEPGTFGLKYPSLGEAVKEIEGWPEFLNISPPEDFRGLNGKRVKQRIEDLEKGIPLKECFIMDTWHSMFRDEPFYVIDGMHSLVAYGIWSQRKPDKFPINVWLCTNSVHQMT